MSVSRKFADLLTYFNPFAANLARPPKDQDVPVRKRPRLEASTSIPTAADASDVADVADVDTFVDAQMAHTVATASPADADIYTGVDVDIDAQTNMTDATLTIAQTPAGPKNYGKWTPEEDAKLTEAVTERGNAWVRVAAMVPGRSVAQCRYRWVECLDPDISTGNWTPEEDATLTIAVTQLGKDWVQVAAMVPGRTNALCRQRWLNGLEPNIDQATALNKGKWSPEEDGKLIGAVTEYGDSNWVRVAAMVLGRTNQHCR
jgi:hypothetical protein